MRRLHGCKRSLAPLVSFLLLSLSSAASRADDVEHRDFSILVDGKDAGHSRITITVQNDGTTVVTASAKVKINLLLRATDRAPAAAKLLSLSLDGWRGPCGPVVRPLPSARPPGIHGARAQDRHATHRAETLAAC
jgi:hypothetical protein